MRDIREGICPLCAHQEIVEAVPAEFGDGNMELQNGVAVTYAPRWIMGGRNPSHPKGLIRLWFCRSCGYSQQFVLEPGEVPIDAEHRTALHRGRGAGQDNPDRRRLRTTHATLYLGDAGIDQDWPNGAVHSVRWERPFSIAMHRSPATFGPTADVHVQLKQSQANALAIVAFTLCVTDSPEVQRLAPLTTFLPRLEGEEARLVLRLLHQAARLHNIQMPL